MFTTHTARKKKRTCRLHFWVLVLLVKNTTPLSKGGNINWFKEGPGNGARTTDFWSTAVSSSARQGDFIDIPNLFIGPPKSQPYDKTRLPAPPDPRCGLKVGYMSVHPYRDTTTLPFCSRPRPYFSKATLCITLLTEPRLKNNPGALSRRISRHI